MVVASGSAAATPIVKDAAAATPPEARVTDVMMRSMTSLPSALAPGQTQSPTEATGSYQLDLRVRSVADGDRAVAVGEGDRYLDGGELVGDRAPSQVDLEAIALRVDVIEIDLLQNVPTIGAVTGGDVVDADAQGQPRIGVGGPGQRPATPRPVLHVSAVDVARTDDQVGPGVDGLQQEVQLFWRVTAVGVHLHQRRVLPVQPPSEAGQVCRPQPILGGPVHDVDSFGVGRGQLVGELSGAVGAAVVDDQYMHVGTSLV